MLETAAVAVAEARPFEQIRRGLVELMRASSDDPDSPKWLRRADDPEAYVHNVVDALKELMTLGLLERTSLPSTPRSARAHRSQQYTLTSDGQAWVEELASSRAAAYNRLTGWLLAKHRQFELYLRAVGARPDSPAQHLTVPLLRRSDAASNDPEEFVLEFGRHAGNATALGRLGWKADPEEVASAVHRYVTKTTSRAAATGRVMSIKAIEKEAEKGVVKAAFEAAGVKIDYITVELLRRWTRYLGLATFSYHAAEPRALRLWGTATVSGSGDSTTIERRIGPEIRDRALEELGEVFSEHRARTSQAMYMPIWEARAQVCWRLRIDDAEFDRAIAEMLAGVRGQNLPWEPHLDQASIGAMPPSASPLVLPTRSGNPRTFNVLNLAPRQHTNT